jgi:hypothetical protein
MMQDALYLLAVPLFIGAIIMLRDWRRATLFAMLLMIFEGVLRKWVLPQAEQMLYLVKDVVLLAAYAGFFLKHRRVLPSQRVRPLLVLAGIASVFGLVQIMNPHLPSLALALVGWKS